ncbi:substrate-binding domain-containing protein [Microbacterium sp. NEAU-LLC]|uniref:Substrate-binding domain-containing protein n=1 Tax=Microbacterium helvum TaxID=2773713 RepID=A0ABR8NKA8_9MICO|nr:substrate-binding domain-containing protein [Microbacterium helvum]MBD3941119.1 substrate-binding domain-containing protein [Microbacterium helvum]
MKTNALPLGYVGIAAYNDEAAIRALTQRSRQGGPCRKSSGVIGVDNSVLAKVMVPSLTTVEPKIECSAREIVHAIPRRTESLPRDALGVVRRQIRVLHGGSTRVPA